MIRKLWRACIMLFYLFFCNIIRVNYYLYCFIVLLHVISSFSLTRSLLVPYTYVSIESTDCILLSSFELKAILLISSTKILCLSLLNRYFVFNIHLLLFYELFMIFLILAMSILFFSR